MSYQLYSSSDTMDVNSIILTRNNIEDDAAEKAGFKTICIHRPISSIEELTSEELSMINSIDSSLLKRTSDNNSLFNRVKSSEGFLSICQELVLSYDNKNTTQFAGTIKKLVPELRVQLENLKAIIEDPMYEAYKPKFQHISKLYNSLLANYGVMIQRVSRLEIDLASARSSGVSQEDYVALQISTVPKEQYESLKSSTVSKQEYESLKAAYEELQNTPISDEYKDKYDALLQSTVSKEEYNTMLRDTVPKTEYESLKNSTVSREEYDSLKDSTVSKEEYNTLKTSYDEYKLNNPEGNVSLVEESQKTIDELREQITALEFSLQKSKLETIALDASSTENAEEISKLRASIEESYVDKDLYNQTIDELNKITEQCDNAINELNEYRRNSVSLSNFEALKSEYEAYKETSVTKEDYDKLKSEFNDYRMESYSKEAYNAIKFQLDESISKTSLFSAATDELESLRAKFNELSSSTVSKEAYEKVNSELTELRANSVPKSALDSMVPKSTLDTMVPKSELDNMISKETLKADYVSMDEYIDVKTKYAALQNTTVPKEEYERVNSIVSNPDSFVSKEKYQALMVEKEKLESQLLSMNNNSSGPLGQTMNFGTTNTDQAQNFMAIIKELRNNSIVSVEELPLITDNVTSLTRSKMVVLKEIGHFPEFEAVIGALFIRLQMVKVTDCKIVVFDQLLNHYTKSIYTNNQIFASAFNINSKVSAQKPHLITNARSVHEVESYLSSSPFERIIYIDRYGVDRSVVEVNNSDKCFYFVTSEKDINDYRLKPLMKKSLISMASADIKTALVLDPYTSQGKISNKAAATDNVIKYTFNLCQQNAFVSILQALG